MAKVQYVVIKDAGAQFPVGFEFETDSLHPSMLQHVRKIGRDTVQPEQEQEQDEEPTKPNGKPTKPVKSPDKAPPAPDEDDDNT